MKKIIKWLSDHRYIFCMNPKGWTEEKEASYKKWADKQPNFKSWYK